MQPFRLLSMCVLLFSGTLLQASAADLDKYGGTTAIKGKATGFFHVEEIDGRQCFITPDGNAFFAHHVKHDWSTAEADPHRLLGTGKFYSQIHQRTPLCCTSVL